MSGSFSKSIGDDTSLTKIVTGSGASCRSFDGSKISLNSSGPLGEPEVFTTLRP